MYVFKSFTRVYVFIHAHAYTEHITYMYTCKYVRVCLCTYHAHVYTHIYTYIYTHITQVQVRLERPYISIYTHACIDIDLKIECLVNICLYTCVHTYSHAYTHINIHTGAKFWTFLHLLKRYVCVYVCMYVCNVVSRNCFYYASKPECAIPDDNMYVYLYVCMYVCMYVWTPSCKNIDDQFLVFNGFTVVNSY